MRILPLLRGSLLAVVGAGLVWLATAHAASTPQEIFLPLLAGKTVTSQALNVHPQPDVGRAVSAAIPPAGGQVVATSANQTRFTLSIPAGALAQTTTITLTPVAQITGLPDVELVGAVQIAPLNVFLFQAATLKIEPAQAVPVPQEYPFAYYGGGRDFHPYPIQPYSPGLVYPIGKFDGGYGIARTAAQVSVAEADPPFVPDDPEARLRSQVAELIRIERGRILLGAEPDPTLWPKIRDLALEYYHTIVEPTLQPSTVDCSYAKAHMGNAVGWLRSITLLFGETDEPGADPEFAAAGAAISDALYKALKNCYHEAVTPCIDWNDPQQVDEVLSSYRALLLMGIEEGIIPPADQPECTYVDVTLQGGAFHYEFEPNTFGTWSRAVYFQFPDDTVSSVGFYYPFLPKGTPISGPTAVISISARIDDVWQEVSLSQRYFCRDQKAERLQELMISFADVEGDPPLPPQLYADNIGCWRWTGSTLNNIDYHPLSGVPEYYHHTSAQLTLERDPNNDYFVYESLGELNVVRAGYRIVSPSTVDYAEKLHHVDDEGATTCLQTLTAHITNPANYIDPLFPAITLPNAGFGLPREVEQSGGSELDVDLPYITQGFTCPGEGQSLDHIGLWIAGNLSADGKHIQYNETGPTGEGSGTQQTVINLQAQRE